MSFTIFGLIRTHVYIYIHIFFIILDRLLSSAGGRLLVRGLRAGDRTLAGYTLSSEKNGFTKKTPQTLLYLCCCRHLGCRDVFGLPNGSKTIQSGAELRICSW